MTNIDSELINFSNIEIETIPSQLDKMLDNNREKIAALLRDINPNNPISWATLAQPLEDWNDALEQFWSPISHLHAVADNETLRNVYEQCIPKLTAYGTELGQNQALCAAWKALAIDDLEPQKKPQQTMAREHTLREFRLSGVDLPEAQRQRFAELRQTLATITTQFSNHVLDATQAFTLPIHDSNELAGVPDSAIAMYRQRAAAKNLDGWIIGLDMPAYLPIMQYAENRALREKIYYAYTTRASELGPNAGEFDNGALMAEILALRHQLAEIIGFNNYAELSLASKMADSPADVVNFLQTLAAQSRPQALQEYAELQSFAAAELGINDLMPWDVSFATEKLRLARYDLSQETLRPYFPIDKVLGGLFTIIEKLFSIQLVEINNFDTWHSDVRLFALQKNSQTIAHTYLDLYSRQGKRGGAWMADARIRRRIHNSEKANDGEKTNHSEIQLPIAFLVCNFSPAETGKPALLTHDEVTTLFHEFGHGLHHMLTTVEVAAVSGINGVPWDAVELPSQLLENWCWQPEAISLFSAHYETGEALPQNLLDKMLAAKHFQSAMQMIRQIEFSLFDLRIHSDGDADKNLSVQAILAAVRADVAVYPLPAWNRFANSFSHIFAGGYAAGYYSYKWAEVLSADVFSRFEEDGVFNAETGDEYWQQILSRGGSATPAELFKNFRGREPNTDALLRHSGIRR